MVKRILAILMSLCLLLSVSFSAVATQLDELKCGDVNEDGKLTLEDVTLSQRTLASLTKLKPRQSVAADTSASKGLTLEDVVLMQRHIAGLENNFPAESGAKKVYEISSADALINFARTINSKISSYEGYTIEIKADIDLSGHEWEPIVAGFEGTGHGRLHNVVINGNGHAISNMKISNYSGNAGVAFIHALTGNGTVTINDLAFKNADVSCKAQSVATVVGFLYNDLVLNNVDVINSSITGAFKVASLVGSIFNESSSSNGLTAKNCDVTGSTITGKRYGGAFMVCGMVAFVHEESNEYAKFSNCNLSNTNIQFTPGGSYGYKCAGYVYASDSEKWYDSAQGVTVSNCNKSVYEGEYWYGI